MATSPVLRIGIAAACTLAGSAAVRAQILFDNIGSIESFQTNVGSSIGLVGSPDHQEVAISFTAATSLYLSSADLELWPDESLPVESPNPSVEVALLANGPGGLPGDVLDSSVARLPGRFDSPVPLTFATFSDSVLLNAGVTYWLAVSGADLGTSSAWESFGNPLGGVAISRAEQGFAGPWDIEDLPGQGGARIRGTSVPNQIPAVPEPPFYGAAALLLLGLCILSRRGLGWPSANAVLGPSD